MRSHHRWILLAATAALGLGLAGSALALQSRSSAAKPVYQRVCSNGAVKAIAQVVADQNRGFMKSYSTDNSFFSARWSCKAGTTFEAKRVDRGIYDVRLLGDAGGVPIVVPIGPPVKIGVATLSDGGVQVTLIGEDDGGHDYAVDEPFMIVFV